MTGNLGVSEGMAAMKAGRYPEAIALFEAELKQHPDDLKTLLHLGICHLLNRSENLFLGIYKKAEKLRARMGAIPEDVSRVFSHYEGLVKRVTAAALLVSAVSATATGCGDDDDTSPASSSHKYSGGVYVGDDEEKTGTDSAAPDAGEGDTDTISSAHRYSGGVYVDATDK
jgi:hypothetical protein